MIGRAMIYGDDCYICILSETVVLQFGYNIWDAYNRADPNYDFDQWRVKYGWKDLYV